MISAWKNDFIWTQDCQMRSNHLKLLINEVLFAIMDLVPLTAQDFPAVSWQQTKWLGSIGLIFEIKRKEGIQFANVSSHLVDYVQDLPINLMTIFDRFLYTSTVYNGKPWHADPRSVHDHMKKSGHTVSRWLHRHAVCAPYVIGRPINTWLVVSTPLKNISQLGGK